MGFQEHLQKLICRSKSNELIDEFNKKTIEIIKTMQGLHFSTIDLRNKLSKDHINNNHPIITQVTAGNNNVNSSGQNGDLSLCSPAGER